MHVRGMEPKIFFSILSAVLIGNAVTVALIFGMFRIWRSDKMDGYSSACLIIGGGIGMISAYLSMP